MLRSLTARRMAPVAVLASIALIASGCGGGGSKKKADTESKPSSSPTTATTPAAADGKCDFKSGDLSDSIKAAGAFGKDPEATFSKPLKATSLQRTILTPGTGAMTAKGEQLNLVITAYNGTTGKSLATEPAALKAGDSTLPLSFDAGFDCVPIGSRVITTFAAKDLYGSAGNSQLNIKATDSLVVVTDVVGIVKPLKPAAWNNAPKVTFNKKGTPQVKLTGKPAKTLMLHVIKQGHGATVASGDSVTVNYQGTSWNTGKIFDQSYGKTPATFSTDQVVKGFGAALVGQKVGTTLIVTIPPVDGYGEGKVGSGQLVGETLVFVIAIQNTKTSS
ncbi:MAG TPA: FKBP-type peptidyl-prolyl cis-trans isomerase [Marmoricola sp.]|jgi:peptidylprolyl isomerase|nr:FKBP-type peptidyl-prolyl cis-trans isomerase [Marmoricola sp.]